MLRFLRAGLCAVAVLCSAQWIAGQEAIPLTAVDAASVSSVSYLVELSEYQWQAPLAAGLGSDEVLALIQKTDAEPKPELRETIRLSSLAGIESMVSIGRRTGVTVGRTATGRGEMLRNVQVMEFGTQVKVTAVPQDQRVRLSLTFESSHQLPPAADDAPADVSTTEVATTLMLDHGKPALVSSFGGNRSSVLVVTVKPIK